MNDLISRQVAIDALGDEPEVWTGNDEYAQGLNNQWHYDVNALKAVPSADAVPVVRCKDCKHHYYDRSNIPYCSEGDYAYGWKDDDFCSYGERKDGDHHG